VVEDLLAGDAAVRVADEASLAVAIETLLADPARRAALGRNAARVVASRRGVLDRSVALVRETLNS
jgi:3-deoxy-D-manno-octulosonic-acid transferase